MIKCFHKHPSGSREPMWTSQFHTCAISNMSVLFSKNELDEAKEGKGKCCPLSLEGNLLGLACRSVFPICILLKRKVLLTIWKVTAKYIWCKQFDKAKEGTFHALEDEGI